MKKVVNFPKSFLLRVSNEFFDLIRKEWSDYSNKNKEDVSKSEFLRKVIKLGIEKIKE